MKRVLWCIKHWQNISYWRGSWNINIVDGPVHLPLLCMFHISNVQWHQSGSWIDYDRYWPVSIDNNSIKPNNQYHFIRDVLTVETAVKRHKTFFWKKCYWILMTFMASARDIVIIVEIGEMFNMPLAFFRCLLLTRL